MLNNKVKFMSPQTCFGIRVMIFLKFVSGKKILKTENSVLLLFEEMMSTVTASVSDSAFCFLLLLCSVLFLLAFAHTHTEERKRPPHLGTFSSLVLKNGYKIQMVENAARREGKIKIK